MRAHRLSIRLLAVCLLFLGCRSASRPAEAAQSLSTLQVARAVMEEARYCALITIGDEGHPQARAMDPSSPDEDMRVYFVTNPATRKVGQIEADPRVTLYYFSEPSLAYVTILGTARRVDDPAVVRERWQEKWATHYPGGIESAAVYVVLPERLEVVSVAHGVVGDELTWRPPSLDLRP